MPWFCQQHRLAFGSPFICDGRAAKSPLDEVSRPEIECDRFEPGVETGSGEKLAFLVELLTTRHRRDEQSVCLATKRILVLARCARVRAQARRGSAATPWPDSYRLAMKNCAVASRDRQSSAMGFRISTAR